MTLPAKATKRKGMAIITRRDCDCDYAFSMAVRSHIWGSIQRHGQRDPEIQPLIFFALVASLLPSCFPASHCLIHSGDSGGQQPASTCQICGLSALGPLFPTESHHSSGLLAFHLQGIPLHWALEAITCEGPGNKH